MNHSGSPGIRAVDVWDVLLAAITGVGSIGKLLEDNVDLVLSDYLGKPGKALASDVIQLASDGEVTFTDAAYTKKKEIQVFMAGTVRTTYMYHGDGTADWEYTKVYINGAPVGVERKTQQAGYQQAPAENFTVAIDDLVQLYAYTDSGITGAVQEFRVKFDLVPLVGEVLI